MLQRYDSKDKTVFDVVVVGGGIYGAWITHECARKGLSVLLLEKHDFASQTSANSNKVLHSGIRYIQYGDMKRMFESYKEQRALARLRPQFIQPLSFLIPTYKDFKRSKLVMGAAVLANDVLGWWRNVGVRKGNRYGPGRIYAGLSGEVGALFRSHDLTTKQLNNEPTGAVEWTDALVSDTERLVISVLHEASSCGAVMLNYSCVESVDLAGAVWTVGVRNVLQDECLAVEGRVVINATGPWCDSFMQEVVGIRDFSLPWGRGVNLVVKNFPFLEKALGAWSSGNLKDEDGFFSKKKRLLTSVPWEGHAIIGTFFFPDIGTADISTQELESCVDEVNRAYGLQLTGDSVLQVHVGRLPLSGRNDQRLLKQYRIIDHARHGCTGIMSVVGVKYTTARDVAQKVVRRVFRRLRRKGIRNRSVSASLSEATTIDPVRSVGEEMVCTLSDYVFRRTNLYATQKMTEEYLYAIARRMASVLLWTDEKIDAEVETVLRQVARKRVSYG